MKASESALRQEMPAAHETRWSGRTRGGLIGNWIFVTLVRYVGLRWAYALLVPVSCYFLLFAPAARRASRDFRSRIGYGGASWLAHMVGGFLHFYSFGQILLDRIALVATHSPRFQFEFDGEEHIRSALSQGKGLIMISAHFGNWEIAAHLLKRLDVRVNIVAYLGELAHIRRFFDDVLKNRAFSLIPMNDSVETTLKVMNALARGEIVAMHADRCVGSQGESVLFLGSPARFPTGPHIVAALSGAPVIHAFAVREGMYRYRLHAYPAERLSFSGRKERGNQIREWIRVFAGRLEKGLREHPLQWHNFYEFWETNSSEIENSAGK